MTSQDSSDGTEGDRGSELTGMKLKGKEAAGIISTPDWLPGGDDPHLSDACRESLQQWKVIVNAISGVCLWNAL